MNVFFDTEFIEDGRTIDLISIGMVRGDDELYLVSADFDESKANEWVKTHVLPQIEGEARWSRSLMAERIVQFVGTTPTFWTYFGDYDWVALCQFYGTMTKLPTGWPYLAYDVRQWLDAKGLQSVKQPDEAPHHALLDARWIAKTHQTYGEALA